MSSILEKALTYLLNEEQEKAEQLFHQFIIQRARQIHESLREGDDKEMDESWEKDIAENYFAEDDLTDIEDEEGEEEEPFGDEGGEMGDEMGDEMGGEETGEFGGEMGDEMGDQMGGDMGEGSMEERISELEGELERLDQQFQELSGAEETEHDMDFDDDGVIGDEGEFGDAPSDEMDSDNMSDAEDEMGDDSFDDFEKKDDVEEEFDDITESIVNELEKVSVTLKDGNEIATGKSFQQNVTSPVPQRGINDRSKNAKPVTTGLGKEHSGYDREEAPGVKDTKFYSKPRNTKKSAEEGRERKTKEGDKSALLNDLSSEDGNLKSPIGSKGSVGNNGPVQ